MEIINGVCALARNNYIGAQRSLYSLQIGIPDNGALSITSELFRTPGTDIGNGK